MRRSIGIGALQKDKERLQRFQQKGSSLAKEELDRLTLQIADFKSNLEVFASKYKNEIRKNGAFRKQFQEMCAVVGVDPLRSSSSFWGKLLGFGDFYYELAIQVSEIFMATNHRNGGIMTMEELLERVSHSRTTKSSKGVESITANDILVAIKKLKPLGSNIKEVKTGSSYIIYATPAELNSDHLEIAQLAHSTKGQFSSELIKEKFPDWSDERIQRDVNELIMEGIIWIDEQGPEGQKLYWFAGLFRDQV